MKKAFYLICLIATFLPGFVKATDGTEHPHKGPNAAVRKYIKEQVLPVLIQKRQQFDKELSPAEKTEIAECKAALKQLHALRKSEHNRTTSDDKYYGQEPNANPEFEQRKAIMQRLRVIADRHSNSLQDIRTQLEPARNQWVADIKRLQTANNDEKAKDETQQKWHHQGGIEAFLYPHHLAARFLLLPTTTTAEQLEGELKSEFAATPTDVPVITNGLTSFSLTPNPASNDLQLGNEILPSTNVLKVIDLQGKEVLTLQNVKAAQHLDVSQLANGTYLVQIKSGDQTISKKIIIAK